ncbi:MAG: hypothetical protein P1V20_24755 [Verrucomicrobiales bacterium]|nr:hypothetical protein [Verrucomicrobiales bacterium]
MSTILKRFEIWLLLLIVVAGIWWAFDAEPVSRTGNVAANNPAATATNTGETPEDAGLLEIRNVYVTPGNEGSIIELTLFGRSGTDEPVSLGEDNLELLTSDGEGVHRFFLPFDPNPMLSPDEKSLITLKYWLKNPVDVLWLTYRDQTVKVELPSATI